MSKNIEVSIICLTYNQEEYIKDALEGFLAQETTFGFEILVHDDCSTDRTLSIIKEYEAEYPSIIRVFEEERNQYSLGVELLCEILLPQAQGKYIAVCEGDDYWIYPKKIQKQYDYMEGHPACALACHNARVFDCITNTYVGKFSSLEKGVFNFSNAIRIWGVPTASFFMKKCDAVSRPDFFSRCKTGDEAWKLYLGTKGYIYFTPECWSVYRKMAKNSWSNQIQFGVNKQRISYEYTKSFIELLNNINTYTNEKYKLDIEWRIVHQQLVHCLICCDYDSIDRHAFLRDYYREWMKECPIPKRLWHRLRGFFSRYLSLCIDWKASFPFVIIYKIKKQDDGFKI